MRVLQAIPVLLLALAASTAWASEEEPPTYELPPEEDEEGEADEEDGSPDLPRGLTTEDVRRARAEQYGEHARWHLYPNNDTRYEFHSELVYSHDDHKVKIYRTHVHDSSTYTLPSCHLVDGWFLSLDGLPFWKVSVIHKGPAERHYSACDFTFEDWPEGKNIRDEVPHTMADMKVVFEKDVPEGAKTKWKTGWMSEDHKAEL